MAKYNHETDHLMDIVNNKEIIMVTIISTGAFIYAFIDWWII